MKKIAILACLKANEVCAGVACLNAFEDRLAHFTEYANEEVRLCAFMRCSECGKYPEESRGMTEKLERILRCGVETVHIGVCAKKRDGTVCPYMEKTAEWLENHGIRVVFGTH